MLQLMVRASLAVWLTVALTVVVRPTSAAGPTTSNMQVVCKKELSFMGRDRTLIGWIPESNEISIEAHCNTEFKDRLVDLLASSNALKAEKCFDLAKEYLKLYLEKCGYEKGFKYAIAHIGWKSLKILDTNPPNSLHSYIESYLVEDQHFRNKLRWILAAFESTSGLYREPKTKELWDVRSNLKELQQQSENLYPELSEFTEAYLSYLEAGSPQISKKTIDLTEQKTVGHTRQISPQDRNSDTHSTHNNPFTRIGQSLRRKWNYPFLRQISKQTDCTQELQGNVERWLDEQGQNWQSDASVEKYLKLYLEKCGLEQSFKERIRSMAEDSDTKWDSAAYPTLSRLILQKLLGEQILGRVLSIMRRLAELDDISAGADCSYEFRGEFLDWLNMSSKEDQDFHKLMKNYFVLYLSKCNYGDRLREIWIQARGGSSFLATSVRLIF